MRKTLVALVAVLSLAAASGCSTSGGSDAGDTTSTTAAPTTTAKPTTTTTEAKGIDVDTWAGDFCDNFGAWIKQIQQGTDEVTSDLGANDVESAKAALKKLYGNASSATQTLIDQLQRGGSPDIDQGDAFVADLVSAVEGFKTAAESAKAAVDTLANDTDTFKTGADAINTTFQAAIDDVGTSLSDLDTKYPAPELSSAMNSACNF